MAATYEPISTTTLGSANATVTFTSIPSTYTDLILIISGSYTSGNPDGKLTFNNDTGTNYSQTFMEGDGSATSSGRYNNQAQIYIDAIGGGTGQMNYIYSIMNYANTTTYKTAIGKYSNAAVGLDAIVGMWRSTSAINRIDINASSSTFTSGSKFTLYGVKAA